jgi:O-antigen/teichoic acid export membrane protein
MLTNLPVQLAVTSATKVLYPALSERQDDRRKVGELYLALLFVTVGIVGGIAAGIVPAAEALVLTLLGEKWADAIEVVQVVALAVPFVFASHLSGIVFDSLGLLSVKLKLQTLTIVLFAVLLALAYSAGLVAIGVALVLTEATKLCAYVLLTRRALGLTLPHVAYAIGAGCVVCAGVALPSVLLGTLLTGTGMAPWVRLALAIAVGIGALAVTLTFMWRKIARTSMFGAVGSRLPLLGRLVPRQAQ